jgi:peptidyl-tRNA hydrolase, PTH1 family
MKYLIVGLGNPGDEYAQTRHNIGFDVLDALCAAKEGVWEAVKHGWKVELSHKGRKMILLKPNTYMNLSGKAVAYWMQQEKIALENVIVVTDDLALPVAKLRLKPKGSDGGHNGLKSINASLNTPNYPRLRFGIGNEFAKGQQVDFVLGKWTNDEQILIDEAIKRAVAGIEELVWQGLPRAMMKLN